MLLLISTWRIRFKQLIDWSTSLAHKIWLPQYLTLKNRKMAIDEKKNDLGSLRAPQPHIHNGEWVQLQSDNTALSVCIIEIVFAYSILSSVPNTNVLTRILSKAEGMPPLCTCPSTVTRVSIFSSVDSSCGKVCGKASVVISKSTSHKHDFLIVWRL